MNKEAKKIIKKFKGTAVSDKNDKTIIVRVDTFKMHPTYKKRYKSSQRYKVHDEKNQFKTGETVEFVSCRPLSKDKKWRVINK